MCRLVKKRTAISVPAAPLCNRFATRELVDFLVVGRPWRSRPAKLWLYAASLGVQGVLVFSLHPVLGDGVGFFDLIPSLVAGWLFGPWLGLLGAIVADAMNIFVFSASDGIKFGLAPVELIEHAIVILAAVGAGLAGRQNAKLEEALREREAAHEALLRSREESIRAERLSTIGLLAAGSAHEINNPLTFIRTNAELAVMDLDDMLALDAPPAPDRRALERIRANQAKIVDGANRIAHITKNIKRAANTTTPEAAPVLVQALAETAADLAGPRLTNVRVSMDIPAGLVVYAAEREIVQVLLNLFLNAADAMGGKGTVVVAAAQEGDSVAIRVIDSGVGVRVEDKPKIFRPFHTTKHDGTGLGLSVSRRIAENNAGRLEFESTEGQGAVFILTLPSRSPVNSNASHQGEPKSEASGLASAASV